MSRWFRHYAGMMRDEKLVRVALKSKQPIERVLWIWGAILESAAEIDDVGRFELDTAEAAYFLRADQADLDGIIECLRQLGRVHDGVVANWGDRQFQSDRSTDRVRAHRERKHADRARDSRENDEPVGRNDSETGVKRFRNAPETETETETETEKKAAALSARDPVDLIFEAIGVADDPHWYGHKSTVGRWLDGWDLELDILPTVRRMMAGRGPPRSPRFFEAAIAEAHAARLAPLPVATAKPKAAHERRDEPTNYRNLAEAIIDRTRAASAGIDAGLLPASGGNVAVMLPKGRSG